jgi:protein tyrosine phosphatase
MMIHSLESFQNFIDEFHKLSPESHGNYLVQEGRLSNPTRASLPVYSLSATKQRSFSTKEICLVAQQALSFLQTNSEGTIQHRVDLLHSLELALNSYVVRVEKSIRSLWWMRLLSLFRIHSIFGHPIVERPKNIISLQHRAHEIANSLSGRMHIEEPSQRLLRQPVPIPENIGPSVTGNPVPYSVVDLKSEARRLREHDYAEAAKIKTELNEKTKIDPFFTALLKDDAHKHNGEALTSLPYEYNRFGRETQGTYLNASEVRYGDHNFIMASCPHTAEEAQEMVSCFLDTIQPNSQGVWISLLTSHDFPEGCNNFWKEDFLRKHLRLGDGWTLNRIDSHLIQEGLFSERSTIQPRLIQTNILIEMMELLCPPHTPIGVNCIQGRGRSGSIVVFYLLLQQIRAEIRQGTPLCNIFVNIPEVIYALRKQRPDVLDCRGQMTQLYEFLGDPDFHESILRTMKRQISV